MLSRVRGSPHVADNLVGAEVHERLATGEFQWAVICQAGTPTAFVRVARSAVHAKASLGFRAGSAGCAIASFWSESGKSKLATVAGGRQTLVANIGNGCLSSFMSAMSSAIGGIGTKVPLPPLAALLSLRRRLSPLAVLPSCDGCYRCDAVQDPLEEIALVRARRSCASLRLHHRSFPSSQSWTSMSMLITTSGSSSCRIVFCALLGISAPLPPAPRRDPISKNERGCQASSWHLQLSSRR